MFVGGLLSLGSSPFVWGHTRSALRVAVSADVCDGLRYAAGRGWRIVPFAMVVTWRCLSGSQDSTCSPIVSNR